VQTDLLLACDAVLMGRRTYDSFAVAWPSRSGDHRPWELTRGT
jgi:dihydrofolate reductase